MFDGNHRIRREVNLGGNARRRGARGRVPPSSSSARKRGVGGGVGVDSSKSATGVTDRKSDILENARIGRERRREEKRRNDAARAVQRTYRGHRGRGEVAAGLTTRRDRLRTALRTPGTSVGRDEEVGRFVREWASVLSTLWGPYLLRYSAKIAAASSSSSSPPSPQLPTPTSSSTSSVVSADLLGFGRALDGAEGDPWAAAPPGGGDEDDASSSSSLRSARADFVRGRLARVAFARLRDLAKAQAKAQAKAAAAAAAAAKEGSFAGSVSGAQDEKDDAAATAVGLARLAARLVTSTGGDGDGEILLPALRNGPRSSEREGNGVVSLFSAFRDWFWLATANWRQPQSDGAAATEEEVAAALLRLSCRAAGAMLQKKENFNGNDNGDNNALAVLGAAIFCSRPDSFRSAFLPGASDGKGEGVYNSPLGAELQRCREYFLPEGEGEEWHGSLLSSLARALLAPSSPPPPPQAANEEKAGLSASASEAARRTVEGREVYLLLNAVAYLDRGGGGNGGDSKSESGGNGNGNGKLDLAAATGAASLLRRVLLGNGGTTTGGGRTLTVLAAMAASGEDVRALLLEKNASEKVAPVVDLTNDEDDDESSDSDDDEEEENETAGAVAPSASRPAAAAHSPPSYTYQRKTSNSRLTRQQVQTVPKLDRKYRTEAARIRRDAVESTKRAALGSGKNGEEVMEATADLCEKLGSGGIMARLGAALLVDSPTTPTSTSSAGQSQRQELEPARADYCEVLSELLQFCTSSHNSSVSSSSPLLSAVAFRPALVGALWSRWRRTQLHAFAAPAGNSHKNEFENAAVASTFCDAFGHRLVAVDDEEFLAEYCSDATSASAVSSAGTTIRAVDVVSSLRSALYELYWTKPVLSDDVVPPASVAVGAAPAAADGSEEVRSRSHRARLLLSGTRLYNSLYERWCRLPRTPTALAAGGGARFCEEESWYFPRLVTRERDDDGAVMPGTSAAAASGGRRGEDDESMGDDEDDSAASPMDVDADEAHPAAAAAAAAAAEESDALASSFRDPKMARVLTSIPQSLPFERRVLLFTSLLDADKARTQDEERSFRAAMMRMQRDDMDSDEEWEFTGRERVEIRRDRLYEDSMDQLNGLGRKLRRRVQVTFVNKHGAQEAGIDGGGVFKEFLDDLIKDAFDPQGDSKHEPLFIESPVQTLQVNPAAGTSRRTLDHYEFLGRVLGKAVYESILVEPQFCLPFLNQLLGKRNVLDDLKNLDPEYYRHLNALRRMNGEDIESLGLTFEYTTSAGHGSGTRGRSRRVPRTVELVPGGGSIPVTRDNVIRYVHLVAHRKLNAETAVQTRSFLRGFRDLVPASWVRLFSSSHELQKLIGGDDSVRGIDVDGLRSVMQYAGGYHPSQPCVQWFWQVLEEMSASQQRAFLRFMTSCSRQPLLGFRALVPLPCIQQIRLREGDDDDGFGFGGRGFGGGAAGRRGNEEVRLPTSSTCMNLLKLPKYPSKEVLKEKLLYAIEAGAGFELS